MSDSASTRLCVVSDLVIGDDAAPGVYFVEDRPFTDAARIRAAVWGYGVHATASGLAAAWWHGATKYAPQFVEVTVPRASNGRRRAGTRLRRRDLKPADIVERKGLRVTELPLTVVEAAVRRRRRRATDGLGTAAPRRTAPTVACASPQQGPPRISRREAALAGRLRRCALGGRTAVGETPARGRASRMEDELPHRRIQGRRGILRSRRWPSRSTAGPFTATMRTFRTIASARTTSRYSAGRCFGSRGWT